MTDYAACAERLMQAYNAKDFDALEAGMAPDINMAHYNRGASFSRAEDLIAVIKAFAADIMPDRQFLAPERVLVCGNVVVREAYWTGTPTQDIPGFATKGEPIRFRLCSLMTFDEQGILVDWKDHG